MKKNITIFLAMIILLTGCIPSPPPPPKTATQTSPLIPSLFRTTSRGDVWAMKNDIYGVGGVSRKIQYANLNAMKYDPQDPNTIYIATDTGIYYTFNRGDGWFQTLSDKGIVNDIAIDPANKCVLYALVHDSIYKSTDCSRSWDRIHFTSTAGEYFTAILVSKADSRLVFVGTSTGLLLQSSNGGVSWEIKQPINSPIGILLPHPNKPQSFIMVTPNFGIQRTDDNAQTWISLNQKPVYAADGKPMVAGDQRPLTLNDLPGTTNYYDLKFDTSQKDGLIYASSYGIFRFINNDHWQEIKILSLQSQQRIFSVAVDGTNGNNIYFATTGAFYRSSNAGVDWTVKRLAQIFAGS